MAHGDRPTVPLRRDDEKPDYAPGDRFTPETPQDEAKVVAKGRAARTPFVLVGSAYITILSFAAIVVGIVVLAMWLA